MKTKVFPVEPFDPELVKYEFRRKINHRLLIMKKQEKAIRRPDTSSAVRRSKAEVFRCKALSAQKASILTAESVTVDELLEHIGSAMKLQQNVFEAAVVTNRAFTVQLLLIFLESFISFTFNSYYMISVLTDPTAFKLPFGESMEYLSQHLIQPFFCVISVVLAFSLIKHKFHESAGIVNKLIIHAQDNDVRTRLSAFSQQIQSNLPLFNVYRFFYLDGSVLFSMISATTTYLIILVQTIGSQSKIIPSLSAHLNKLNRTRNLM